MKKNGVIHDALRLYLFPYSLTHHASAWFDRLPKNSIHTFEEMVSKFLSKYFPHSMVTKLRNDISNFQQLPDEFLFEAWERCKLLIDWCPNHNMLLVTQIDAFYNGLTLRHPDTINAAVGAERGESSRSTTFSSPKIAARTKKMDGMSTAILRMFQSSQQVNVVNPSCNTCGDPHHYSEYQAAGGYTQDVYAAAVSYNGREDIKVITTRSGMTLAGPSVPSPPSYSFKEDLLTNKEKLFEMANTPLNKSCSTVLLKKLLEKLRDTGDFLFHKLMLHELTPTRMTLELATRSIAYPAGIAEDVNIQVGKFTFPADFIVVDYDIGPRETDTFLSLDDSIPPDIDNGIYDSKGNILFLEELLDDDPTSDLPLHLPVFAINENEKIKSSIEDPPDLELKDLPPHLEIFQRCMVAIFHDMIEKTLEVFMDDFSVFDDSSFLSHLDMMLKRCEDTNLVLNWENAISWSNRALSSAIRSLKVQDAKVGLLRWIRLLQKFDIEIRDKKGAENLAADHLSRLENPPQWDLVGMKINGNFQHESLNMISLNPDDEPPWFADIVNYLVGNVLVKGMSS
uniref:Reverse transcriptase domain-containing protein n=1 Tax=Tanacetum cinerariifolium TaxID=118510 RepID=A0A699HD10_TANCI|nr:reverse transcriptase domain-containing protein [Tanacetum cinerariifolium]